MPGGHAPVSQALKREDTDEEDVSQPPEAVAAVCGGAAVRHCERRVAGARRRSDQDRHRHGVDRRARRQRQGGDPRDEDLGRGDQRQGRAPRPPGAADLLRRPEQPLDRAGHLHKAARRRQGRPDLRRLRHQPLGAGYASRHSAQHDVLRVVRAGCEPRVPVPEIFRNAAGRRTEPVRRLLARLLRSRCGAEPKTEDPGDHGRRCRVPAQRRRRRAREREESGFANRLR